MATGWLGPNTLTQTVQILHYTCKPSLVQKALVTGSPVYAGVLHRRAMRFLATVALHESGSEQLLECFEDLPLPSLDIFAMAVCGLVVYSLVTPALGQAILRHTGNEEPLHTRDTEL